MIALAWFKGHLPCTLACLLHYGCVMEENNCQVWQCALWKKNCRHDYISKAAIEKHNLIAAAYVELWSKGNTEKNSVWLDHKMDV